MKDICLTGADCMEVFRQTADVLAQNEDYITGLDAATGDGDHWINMNMGYRKLLEQQEALAALPPAELFQKAAMTMMSVIGGSSGALYGAAFLRAAKELKDAGSIGSRLLCGLLNAMCQAIMERRRAKPGAKTRRDALYPAVQACREGLDAGAPAPALMDEVAKAAWQGVENTRDMPAVRGRAYYQAERGVGHIDPGAVTMAYFIQSLTRVAQQAVMETGE